MTGYTYTIYVRWQMKNLQCSMLTSSIHVDNVSSLATELTTVSTNTQHFGRPYHHNHGRAREHVETLSFTYSNVSAGHL